jgi:hypothetical protein
MLENKEVVSMTDRELLELIAAQVGKLTIDVDGFKSDLTVV